jgi:CarD family transcriptional regulator
MSTSKSKKAAPQKAASKKPAKTFTQAAPAKKAPAKPLQAKPASPAKPAAKHSVGASAKPAAAPKPKAKTVKTLTTAQKPKLEIAPAAKPKAAPKPAVAKPVPAARAVAPKAAVKAAAPAPKAEDALPPVATQPEAAPKPPVADPKPAAPAPQSHSGVISGPMRPMTPPRAMAKAEIFVDGDFVVYPTHGVGKVERIATEEIAGHTLELIHITFDENRMTLRVPTNKARTAGLRKLASRKQFDDVLATLKGRARIKRTMWSRRAQEYEAKINSGDPGSIAEVVRDLHRNAGQPDQSFSERQIYESALDRLAAEYAALEQVDKPTAIERLIAHLKSE